MAASKSCISELQNSDVTLELAVCSCRLARSLKCFTVTHDPWPGNIVLEDSKTSGQFGPSAVLDKEPAVSMLLAKGGLQNPVSMLPAGSCSNLHPRNMSCLAAALIATPRSSNDATHVSSNRSTLIRGNVGNVSESAC